MFNYGIVVLCLLSGSLGLPFSYDEQHENYYNGPPAPLNPDGTVAFTPEYERIRDEHGAFFDLEYNRIKSNVDDAIPFDNKYHAYSHESEDHGQNLPEHESSVRNYESSLEDEGTYKPELYEDRYIRHYDDGQYRPQYYERNQRKDNHYNTPLSAQGSTNSVAYAPATLNVDGAVAHTPEYNAIASSFLSYNQALSRHRREAERYQGPPAPLNQDLTVDNTPDVKHFNDAHFSAVANQLKRLQEAAALAAAHPDRTSPPSKDYNPNYQGQQDHFARQPHPQEGHLWRNKRSYSGRYRPSQPNTRHYDDGQYRPQQYRHDYGQYRPHQHKHDDGQYRPQQHKHDDGQYRPHQHKHFHGQYNPSLHQVVDYNTVPFQPAPLRHDGTVAHLPEYHNIAASHLAAHQSTLSHIPH